MGLHTSGLQRIGDSAGCLAVARLHTRSHMFAMLAALLLNLAPAAASSSPPLLQAPSSNARSASLLASETASLERKVARQSSLLAAWLPLVVGLGAGPLASGVGYWLMTSITGYTFGSAIQAFFGIAFFYGGPVIVLAGIVTAIVFAVQNIARQERLEATKQELARSRQALEKARADERPLSLVAPWREGLSVPPSTTVATF